MSHDGRGAHGKADTRGLQRVRPAHERRIVGKQGSLARGGDGHSPARRCERTAAQTAVAAPAARRGPSHSALPPAHAKPNAERKVSTLTKRFRDEVSVEGARAQSRSVKPCERSTGDGSSIGIEMTAVNTLNAAHNREQESKQRDTSDTRTRRVRDSPPKLPDNAMPCNRHHTRHPDRRE